MLASQVALKRRQNNEAQLEKELGRFFRKLKKSVLKELNEYWSDYQLLQGQVNLMLSPIHEAHKEYYEIIRKYKLREYQLGKAEAKRLTKRANKDKVSLKAVTTLGVQGFVDKDKNNLFGTIPKAEEDLLNRTFRASENTLNRVDNQLNQIISDGYREGKGINQVANDITKRFDQLADWEARRIARTEINTSHNQATRDQYKEDGVEYTQWIAANDDRTRDSHVDVDGEIIPIDGKYSNGLAFPGDTSGPIEEWINCRCSNAPFVIPYGFMAPSFSPFRESDLVPINTESLSEPSQEQLEQNLTQEQRSQYEQYTKAVEEAQSIIDSKFSLPRERLQARTQLEYNLSKLNQLKLVANGELARGYTSLISAVAGTPQEPTDDQLQTLSKDEREQIQWAKSVLSKDFHTERMKQKAQSTLDELYSKALNKPKKVKDVVKPVETEPLKPKTKIVEEQPVKPKLVSEETRVNRMSSQELYDSMTKADKKKYDKAKTTYENGKKYEFKPLIEKGLLEMRKLEQKQRDKLLKKQNKGKPKTKTERDLVYDDLKQSNEPLWQSHKSESVLSSKSITKLEKWADKKAKGSVEFGYRFNIKTGELMGRDFKGGRSGVTLKGDSPNVGSVHVHTDELSPWPSGADIKAYRCDSGSEHYVMSTHEVWYIHAEEHMGMMGRLVQVDIDRVYDKCVKESNDYLKQQLIDGKLKPDEASIKTASDIDIGNRLIKEFSKKEWKDKGLTVERYLR